MLDKVGNRWVDHGQRGRERVAKVQAGILARKLWRERQESLFRSFAGPISLTKKLVKNIIGKDAMRN